MSPGCRKDLCDYCACNGRTCENQGLSKEHNKVALVWRYLHPLQTRKLPLPPQDGTESVRPPAAFGNMKTITARSGHALLLEYQEERPLFMLQRGMGMRLTTYYR